MMNKRNMTIALVIAVIAAIYYANKSMSSDNGDS